MPKSISEDALWIEDYQNSVRSKISTPIHHGIQFTTSHMKDLWTSLISYLQNCKSTVV